MKKKIMLVVGARPNYMKIAPIMSELKKYPDEFEYVFIHTGQHYDKNMGDDFFKELGLPDVYATLGVGSATHAYQTAKVMERFELFIDKFNPDLVIVVGDVNSTLACALVAKKKGIQIAHVEAGLRSYDDSMPEEINRRLTDSISDFLFTHCREAESNLKKEGITKGISFVGNTMIDSLIKVLPKVREMNKWGGRYILVTLHRPYNVDNPVRLKRILNVLNDITKFYHVIFPLHPRTKKKFEEFKPFESDIYFEKPLGYLDFIGAQRNASLVITDSGGVQEETTYLGVPCLTLRPNTERNITISSGTNHLTTISQLESDVRFYINRTIHRTIPSMWDGKASERIVNILRREL